MIYFRSIIFSFISIFILTNFQANKIEQNTLCSIITYVCVYIYTYIYIYIYIHKTESISIVTAIAIHLHIYIIPLFMYDGLTVVDDGTV